METVKVLRVGRNSMPREKMVYVSSKTHDALKILAARRNRPMGEVVDDLVEHALADVANPWLGAEGLGVQQKAFARVWDDPALDVYDDD
jgi:hypothetical protein